MNHADLISRLRAAGDPLHLLAADALEQLEAVARLNGETIRSMQRAARAQESEVFKAAPEAGLSRPRRLPQPA